MSWQDITLAICNALFVYSLIPQVYHQFKIKKGLVTAQTSAITALALYVVGFVFLTLKLYVAAVVDFTTATLWTVLLIQRWAYKH